MHKAYIEIGSLEESKYKTRLADVARRHSALLAEKQKYEHLVISEEEKRCRVGQIEQIHKKLKRKLASASYETKTQILRLLVNRIDLQPANNLAIVEFNFPTERLVDIIGGRCPSTNFNLVVEVPLISPAELHKIDNPTRLKQYSGDPHQPLLNAAKRKADLLRPVGGVVKGP